MNGNELAEDTEKPRPDHDIVLLSDERCALAVDFYRFADCDHILAQGRRKII